MPSAVFPDLRVTRNSFPLFVLQFIIIASPKIALRVTALKKSEQSVNQDIPFRITFHTVVQMKAI